MLTLYQPRIFREFELEGTLGSGGFGVVCKARHKTCKQTYAIKIIPFQEDENLNREFKLLSVLNHPNVVRFHNVWFDHDAKQPEETTDPVNDNLELDPSTDSSESADLYGINIANRYCFIQMELCDTSLRELLYDKEFDQEAVPGYVLQICEGLKHIHDNKIIHRDLKPENIFLTNNIIKIGDFGLSKSLESDDTDDERLKFYNTVCGTPIYMAPEMNNGKEIAKYDTKVDMYSLGIILLEVMQKMTFHHFTFIIKDYQETGYFDSNNTLTLNKDNKDIIKNLLQFDPKKRFDCNQVLEKLNELKMLGTDKFRQIVSQKSVRMEQVYLYDRILSNIDLRSMDLRNVVLKKAEEIFELHGGTPLQLPIFGPVKTADTKDVNVISKHGSGVSVGTCFRKRFAEYVNYSGANIESNRYFSLGTYFTQSDAFIPNEVQECSFDIVATEEKSEFFIDAEILYIAKEIIDLLPSVKFKETIFYINHKLFYRALKSEISNVFYKYKKELFDTFAKASVEQLSKEDFEAELKNINISPYQKKRLLSLYQPISLDNTEELNKLRKNKFRNTAIEKIQKLAGVLEIFGINKENIYIFPLLNTQTCYYSGIFSQVYMKKTNSDVKMTLVASGGRYDKYVKDKYSVVGITFHVENITKNIISHFQFVTVIVRENETEIDCLPILKFLWNSGIPCRISLKSKNEGKDLLLSYYKLYPHKENVVLQLQTESFQNRNFYIGAMNHKLIKVIQGFITFFSNVN